MLRKKDCGSSNIRRERPTPAKTAEKAENHMKEGPINATIDKSGIEP